MIKESREMTINDLGDLVKLEAHNDEVFANAINKNHKEINKIKTNISGSKFWIFVSLATGAYTLYSLYHLVDTVNKNVEISNKNDKITTKNEKEFRDRVNKLEKELEELKKKGE